MRHHSVPGHSCALLLPGCGGRAGGGHLPAFTACTLWASVVQEGAGSLLSSSVWGGAETLLAWQWMSLCMSKTRRIYLRALLAIGWGHYGMLSGNPLKPPNDYQLDEKDEDTAGTNPCALALCSPRDPEPEPFTTPMSALRGTRIPYVWWDRLRLVLL